MNLFSLKFGRGAHLYFQTFVRHYSSGNEIWDDYYIFSQLNNGLLIEGGEVGIFNFYNCEKGDDKNRAYYVRLVEPVTERRYTPLKKKCYATDGSSVQVIDEHYFDRLNNSVNIENYYPIDDTLRLKMKVIYDEQDSKYQDKCYCKECTIKREIRKQSEETFKIPNTDLIGNLGIIIKSERSCMKSSGTSSCGAETISSKEIFLTYQKENKLFQQKLYEKECN